MHTHLIRHYFDNRHSIDRSSDSWRIALLVAAIVPWAVAVLLLDIFLHYYVVSVLACGVFVFVYCIFLVPPKY
jgi:hypothetical protein